MRKPLYQARSQAVHTAYASLLLLMLPLISRVVTFVTLIRGTCLHSSRRQRLGSRLCAFLYCLSSLPLFDIVHLSSSVASPWHLLLQSEVARSSLLVSMDTGVTCFEYCVMICSWTEWTSTDTRLCSCMSQEACQLRCAHMELSCSQ